MGHQTLKTLMRNNQEKDAVMMIYMITLERMMMGMIQCLAICSIGNFGEKNFRLISRLQKSTHAKHYCDDDDFHFQMMMIARLKSILKPNMTLMMILKI